LPADTTAPVDPDGRFRVEGLIPNLKYGASAQQGFMGLGEVFRDVTLAPGEVKDLGDLKVVQPRRDNPRALDGGVR
jgi:hypothetical protein